MAKIAKNIKSFRADSGLSQEALAEKINVSRQTVSSWETGRTQPDIEMLETLSLTFGVSVEELIYGKRNRVGLDPPKKPDRGIIITVLTVFGTLMTVAGLTILFARFWEELSIAKNFFALLPLIAGAGLTLFAFTKRKESIVWHEGAAVAWTVGIAVTNALMNSLNSIDFGFAPLLLLDCFLLIPVMYITKGIFPLVAFFYGTSHSLVILRNNGTGYFIVFTVLLIVLFAAGVLLTFRFYFKDKTKKAVGFWTVLAAALFNWISVPLVFPSDFGDSAASGLAALSALSFLVVLYCFGEKMPYKSVGMLGGAGCAIVCAVMAILFTGSFFADLLSKNHTITVPFILLFLTAAVPFALNIKNIKKDSLSVLLIALSLLQEVMFFICAESTVKGIDLIKAVPALGIAVVIIIKGVLQAKLSYANFGMLTAAVVLIAMLIGAEADTVIIGAVIALTGVVLLAINKMLLNKFAKESEAENNA